MKVLDYRILSVRDKADRRYRAWSRAYEYPAVFQAINEVGLTGDGRAHNTSCGSEGIHLRFCRALNRKYPFSFLHSDLFPHVDLPNYRPYNITKPWPWEHTEKFDIVINVSTVEHLPKPLRLEAIKNLLRQTKEGGHLILTFDWPRVCNRQIEEFVGAKIQDTKERLNGGNSIYPDRRYRGLNIIFLHLVK